jgi:hypothetical protein
MTRPGTRRSRAAVATRRLDLAGLVAGHALLLFAALLALHLT